MNPVLSARAARRKATWEVEDLGVVDRQTAKYVTEGRRRWSHVAAIGVINDVSNVLSSWKVWANGPKVNKSARYIRTHRSLAGHTDEAG